MTRQFAPAAQAVLDALQRYETRINALSFPANYDFADLFDVQWKGVESAAAVEQAETAIRAKAPAELIAIWTTLGALELPAGADWNVLTLFDSSHGLVRGLLDTIVATWGDRPELQEYLSAAEYKQINESYFCFGRYTHDDNCHTYLCFDRNGKADSYIYDQDDWQTFEQTVIREKLLRDGSASLTVPEVLDTMIDVLLAAKEEERAEWDDGDSDEKLTIRLQMPVDAPADPPSATAQPDLLMAALRPLLESSNAQAVFETLRDWPTRDATWASYVESRITAPSCTSEQRQTLKKLLKDNA